MDQRRVVGFLAISVLVLILFAPKAKPPGEEVADNAIPAEVNQVEDGAVEELIAAEESASSGEEAADEVAGEGVAAGEGHAEEPELEYVSLGSVAEDSAYRIMATFTTQGAGVRRVEIASPRYRDLHDKGGYVGHLEVVASDKGGLLVQALGGGTPAEAAGIEIGDRIVSANGEEGPLELHSPAQLAELLSQHKPGEPLVLQVSRDDTAAEDRTVMLTRRPLEVIRPEIENFSMRPGEIPEDLTSPASFQFTFEQLGKTKLGEHAAEIVGVELREGHWEVAERDETSVTFRKKLPKYSLEVLKRYRLEPVPESERENRDYPGYGLKLEVEIRNLSKNDFEIAYQLDGPNGLPTESWWFANKISRNWGAAGLRDVVARYEGNDTVEFSPSEIIKSEPEPMQGPPLAYIGIDAQYFSAAMLPIKSSLSDIWIDEARFVLLSPKSKKVPERRFANVTFRLVSHPMDIPAGGVLKHSYEIFTGPKRPELLSQYFSCEATQYSLDGLLTYGWFGGVAKIMLSVLHFFYGITSNYGIAIIMLTVLVRSCMFPISRKQALSMAKMQELKPEMDRLKEKYKNDMQKQSQAMQELYRKNKINPLAGCLPMFLQLPIFLGLYRSLMVDVELRQAPLISESIRWCSNLAAPDMFYDWTSFMPAIVTEGQGIMVLGPYLNVLPLVTVSLFMLQQKLFMPEPANEQAAMQQKVMKFVMLFMGLMFFKVASGLCLYFIASSMWGIAERKLLPKPATPDTVESVPTKSISSGGSRNGQSKSSQSKKKKQKKKR